MSIYVDACEQVSRESGWPVERCWRCGIRCLAKHGVRLCPPCRIADQKVVDRNAKLTNCGSNECVCGGRKRPASENATPSEAPAPGDEQLNLLDAA